MSFEPLRWLARNLSTLILAFILSIAVWVSAVINEDPNEERTYTRPITVEGLSSDLMIIGEVPTQARLTLRAPRSILTRLSNNPSQINVWVDLSGLDAGQHSEPIKITWAYSPVRLVNVDPQEVNITLERLISKVVPVEIKVDGEPPQGYRKGALLVEPDEVTVSGRQSKVEQVELVRGDVNIAGVGETLNTSIPLVAIDGEGTAVNDVTLSPRTATITQPITLLGGYRNVVVKVVTEGQLANGYRLTNVFVSPPTVTVYSENPQLVNDLPGFLETLPVDLTGLNDDIEVRKDLSLPEGISLVGEQSVLVQISVAANEGSRTISLPVEAVGLPPELVASISPPLIDVIVTGPIPLLDALTPANFRAVIDLTGVEPGTYQIEPLIDLVPDQVQVETVIPPTVEVLISPPPTATPVAAEGLPPSASTP